MFKTSRIIKWIYPELLWKRKVDDKILYLTFDDGPVPGITENVLELLDKYNAKATFFCVGENIKKHPAVFLDILKNGHQVGNHTFNHLNGWKSDNENYFSNIELCDSELSRLMPVGQGRLFRPPHGRIKKSQIKYLNDKYLIVMWDILTKDYDHKIPIETCLNASIRLSVPGSIVVFHDRYKNEERLKFILPRYLDHFANKGYEFHAIQV